MNTLMIKVPCRSHLIFKTVQNSLENEIVKGLRNEPFFVTDQIINQCYFLINPEEYFVLKNIFH